MQDSKAISNEWYGTLLAALSAMLLGTVGFSGTHLLHDNFTIASMLFWRFSIAAICMAGFTIIAHPLQNRQTDIKSCLHTLMTAALLYSLASALYFVAASSIGTGLAAAIFFTFPVFVTIFAFIFDGFIIDKYTLISLLAICTGVILIKGHLSIQGSWHGVFYALLCAFFYATYVYRSRAISKIIAPSFLTLLVCIGNTIIFFIFDYLTGEFLLPKSSMEWCYVLLLSIFGTAIPIQLLLESMKYITPVKASILASLQIVVTVLIGWLVLNEPITLVQFCGVAVLISGAIIIQKNR